MTEHSGAELSNDHAFSDRERAFFAAQITQINALIAAMNNAANLVRVQNGLEGNWQVKPDGSGLVKIETDV
jgi:outer membrane protein TolC